MKKATPGSKGACDTKITSYFKLPRQMPLVTPVALVEEFKKSGEFDRLRRELLTQFQNDDSFPAFKSKIEDMARHWLFSEEMMQYLPQDSVHKELAQEIDRYPIVSRAILNVQMLSDEAFAANIHSSVQKILREDKGEGSTIPNDAVGQQPNGEHLQKAGDNTQHSTTGLASEPNDAAIADHS